MYALFIIIECNFILLNAMWLFLFKKGIKQSSFIKYNMSISHHHICWNVLFLDGIVAIICHFSVTVVMLMLGMLAAINTTHKELCLLCFEDDKAVLCEKPVLLWMGESRKKCCRKFCRKHHLYGGWIMDSIFPSLQKTESKANERGWT